MEYPERINLRAAVLLAPPFAMLRDDGEEEGEGGGGGGGAQGTGVVGKGKPRSSSPYVGFQPDLLDRLVDFARKDGVDLTFDLRRAPVQYGPALDLVATDCADLAADAGGDGEHAREDCDRYDLIVGDYYCSPDRSVRVDFTPAWLRTTMTTLKFVGGADDAADGGSTAAAAAEPTAELTYDNMAQLEKAGGRACVPEGAYLSLVTMAKFPDARYYHCPDPVDCIRQLKAGNCSLYVDDELLLRYRASTDPTLQVSRGGGFNTQYLVWPVRADLDRTASRLLNRWTYAAVANATLDELYREYFDPRLCPLGYAGADCADPCDPNHGESDAAGRCVCVSTKWTGPDCAVEVVEDINLIPPGLKIAGYVMFATAAVAVVGCAAWLCRKRRTAQVRKLQPFFLNVVLFGCLVSTSAILALAQESPGDGPVPACMAAPWLYSVGFCITFGTLSAKMWRIKKLFVSAARMERATVTVRDTLVSVGAVLLVDILILAVWTGVDPLQWTRRVLLADKFGELLSSQGYCTSDHLAVFLSLLAALHFAVLAVGSYLCYLTRAIPTQFSEGKFVSLAIISNLQVFVIGLPVLVIVGYDSDSSFFVRSAIIWLNNISVLGFVFGNLIYSVYTDRKNLSTRAAIKSFVDKSVHSAYYRPSQPVNGLEDEDEIPQPPHDWTIQLIDAASKGDLVMVRSLVRKESIVVLDDDKGSGRVSVNSRANINAGDYDRRTALHLAAGEGHADVVEELCVRGADVNVEDRWGGRPLDDAIRGDYSECIEILHRYGANLGRRHTIERALNRDVSAVRDSMSCVSLERRSTPERTQSGDFSAVRDDMPSTHDEETSVDRADAME